MLLNKILTKRYSFTFFFLGTTLRCVIVQLTVQILVNRIIILVPNHRLKRLLRWGPFTIVLLLNIGVYLVWIPAHIKGSGPFFEANKYYSRCEKVIYMILDATLNYYFCSLVKCRLIDAGIRKYQSLYKFNLSIILLSMSLDVLLIGLMSYPNPLVYVQFYPVIFMAKLNIEMTMANMIAKVARSGNGGSTLEDRPLHGSLPGRELDSKDSSLRSHSVQKFPINRDLRPGNKNAVNQNSTSHGSLKNPQVSDNSLYHAWISGGMDSWTRLSNEGSGQIRHNRSPSFRAESRSADINPHRQAGAGVITKNVIVDVRAEDMNRASIFRNSDTKGLW